METVKAPISGKGIKKKKISDKGLQFEVKDGNKYPIYPCLPGVVVKIDGDTVVINHKDTVGKDYKTYYEIDGKITVRENQTVTQSTKIGETDEEVEFKVKEKGSYIDAEKFIGQTIGSSVDGKLTPQQKARCIARSLIAVPHKAFGLDDNDPCKDFFNKKETEPESEPESESNDDKDDKSDRDTNPTKELPQKDSPKLGDGSDKEEEDDDNGILDKGMKLLGSVTENKKLNEEVSRIKNLIKIL